MRIFQKGGGGASISIEEQDGLASAVTTEAAKWREFHPCAARALEEHWGDDALNQPQPPRGEEGTAS